NIRLLRRTDAVAARLSHGARHAARRNRRCGRRFPEGANSPMLSVIIPTYNRAETLPLAIASLLAQRTDSGLVDIGLDIVVADEGSTDAAAQVLAALAARQPAIRVIRQASAGVSAARSAGLAALRPEASLLGFRASDEVSAAGRFTAELSLL